MVNKAITRAKEPKVVYVGNETEKKRGILNLKYTIERGIVTDWDDMETILNYGFHQLDIPSSERPILLTEPLLNPKIQREKFDEVIAQSYRYLLLFNLFFIFRCYSRTSMFQPFGFIIRLCWHI